MDKPSKILLSSLLLPGVLLAPALLAATFDTAKPNCVTNKITTRGHGSSMQALAQMDAVTEWRQRAFKEGVGLGEWHNADNSKLICLKRDVSGLYHCRAHGTPCKSTLSQKHADAVGLERDANSRALDAPKKFRRLQFPLL